MPAGDEQQQIGKAQAMGQAGGERVRLEMVDGDERAARAPSAMALPVVTPTINPPIRPGPAVAATAVDLLEAEPSLGERLGDQRSSSSTWARAAISGTTPPKLGMQRRAASAPRLARGSRRCRLASRRDQGRRGLVAARLDAEHDEVARSWRQ